MPKKLTQKEFIERASFVHQNQYSYNNVEYVNSQSKVVIDCLIHGSFKMVPNNHLSGRGCSFCGIARGAITRTFNTDRFIAKARLKHGEKYDYTNVKYINTRKKVELSCQTHGVFKMLPTNHLTGQGCYLCGRESVGLKSKGIRTWVDRAKGKPCTLYLIKLKNETENHFYKIGVTSIDIERRLSGIPYETSVILEVTSYDPHIIYNTEQSLHQELKKYRYYPRIKFYGRFECFLDVPEIIEAFTTKIKTIF